MPIHFIENEVSQSMDTFVYYLLFSNLKVYVKVQLYFGTLFENNEWGITM